MNLFSDRNRKHCRAKISACCGFFGIYHQTPEWRRGWWEYHFDNSNSRYLRIERDEPTQSQPSVGFYLYVYEDGKCIRDYLQDTFEIAVDMAHEEFGVPKEGWKKIP